MIRVVRIPITKEKFRALLKDERALLLLMGHALNQIAVLMKLVIFSTNKDPEDPIEGRVSAAQSQVILRFLFGVVVETWEFLRRPVNQKIIGLYLPALGKDGTAARDELNKYFGNSNLRYNMRNKFSYHFPARTTLTKDLKPFPTVTKTCRGNGIFRRRTATAFIFPAKWLSASGQSARYRANPT